MRAQYIWVRFTRGTCATPLQHTSDYQFTCRTWAAVEINKYVNSSKNVPPTVTLYKVQQYFRFLGLTTTQSSEEVSPTLDGSGRGVCVTHLRREGVSD